MRHPFLRHVCSVPCLLWLGLILGCSPAPPTGLVVQNPSDPARPFFHDFGLLEFGQQVERTILLSNTESVPIKVLSIHPACTCTRVKGMRAFPAEGGQAIGADFGAAEDLITIPPGGTLEMVMAVNTVSVRPNIDKLAILRIRTSSTVTPFLTFECHLKADKLFTLSPAELRMGDIPMSHGGSKRIEIVLGYQDSAARVIDVLGATGGLQTTLEDISFGAEPRWALTAHLPALQELGHRHETITLRTTDEKGEGTSGQLVVEVWARIVPDLRIHPDPIHFGLVPREQGGSTQVELQALVPGARVKLLSTEFTGDHKEQLKCTWAPAGYVDESGRCERWTLELSAPAGLAPGRFHGHLKVRTDDEGTPVVQAALQGVVR